MEISHPWHDHPLFLIGEAKFVYKCSICRQGLDGNPFYACVDCKYYVHKSCAQLPVQIQHHFHQLDHPLSLRLGRGFACDSCHKNFRKQLRFRCSYCDFDLDVKCALMSGIDTEGKEFIRHSTHQHPLTICSEDGDNPLNCFACKQTTSDLIYGCTPCDYFLHKSCAKISTHILHPRHPKHALTLGVKFGLCDYCGIYDQSWKYYCSFCESFLDVSCFLESAKDAENSERSCFLCGKQHLDSDSCVDSLYFNNQSCIQLPEAIEHEFHSHKPLLLLGGKDFACHSCHRWFNYRSHYGCEECNFRMDVKCALMPSIQCEESDESILSVIPHHFKHQHPLRLTSEVYDINCSACQTTNLSPIYGCIKCDYFLHQSCLELPYQIEHPLHDSHALILQPLGHNFCQICCRKYNGLAFGCIQCLFFVGIECILELQPIVVLKYHPTVKYKYHCHVLCLIENSYWHRCNAPDTFCQFYEESNEFKLTKSYSLRCIECDYNIHFLCSALPCTIKHKSHIHALKLLDYLVEDDSDEHYCDICEEIRNPRLCVYYCEDCSFFSHVHCVMSEIINIFKKTPEKVELMIAGDLKLEDTINLSHDNSIGERLLDLLKRLDANDVYELRHYFPDVELFQREDKPERLPILQNSSFKDHTRNIIEELFFYNDDIFLKFGKTFDVFKPDTIYHIQLDEYELPVIEVEGYKITSNFATLFRALLMKYGHFCDGCELSKNVQPILLYFLCRVLRSMLGTFVGDISEGQILTWLYYVRGIENTGFDINFLGFFLKRILRSVLGLQAMKFADEADIRLDCEIVRVKKKISELNNEMEQLEWHRRQHRVGKIAKESKLMGELIMEAKNLKWRKAGECIL